FIIGFNNAKESKNTVNGILALISFFSLISWVVLKFMDINSEWVSLLGFLGLICLVILLVNEHTESKQKQKQEHKKMQKQIENRQKKMYEKLESIEGFQMSKSLVSIHNNLTIAIDNNSKQVAFVDLSENINLYNYRELLEVEVIEDGETVTKTSRSSQIGGALIGGLIAGGTGAIIGGLSGKQVTNEEVKKVYLKILVNDIDNPVKKVVLLDKQQAIKKSHYEYQIAKEKALEWHSLIRVLINIADKEDTEKQSKETTVRQRESLFVADELLKLAQLHKDGMLTKEEFEAEKQKLLSS
ncbi:SHOCT domain-containing protein, partial [Anoxybacillus gonensis]|uniref:SHOCT domain-containing protein n=1 Tax=Anoxybacillus gonensis TaxID=198467 RepID=UPI0002BDC67B